MHTLVVIFLCFSFNVVFETRFLNFLPLESYLQNFGEGKEEYHLSEYILETGKYWVSSLLAIGKNLFENQIVDLKGK